MTLIFIGVILVLCSTALLERRTMTVQRIKEIQGYDAQTKSNVVFWKVFFRDSLDQPQTVIITDPEELKQYEAAL